MRIRDFLRVNETRILQHISRSLFYSFHIFSLFFFYIFQIHNKSVPNNGVYIDSLIVSSVLVYIIIYISFSFVKIYYIYASKAQLLSSLN